MNQLANELKENPHLAEELLATAGKVSIAFIAVKIRVLVLEAEERDRNIFEARQEAGVLRRELDEMKTKLTKRFQTLNSQMKILQNQLNSKG